MRVGLGLVTCQKHPQDARGWPAIYREAVDLCVLAERVGFDSVWTSEHHFLDDGYMPSLLVLSAAIAQATERVQIGTGVLLAPLHHPLRLAEDAATVDVLSGGRLILGLGAAWRVEELELFGVGATERPGRMRETVAILRGAWSGEVFTHRGRYFSFERVAITPKPERPVPIWIGGFAPGAVRRAGRIADGFFGSSTGTAGIEAFQRARDIALEGVRDAGRDPSAFAFALHVPVFAWDDGDAWDVVKPWYHYLRWKYPDMGAARGRGGPPAPPPPLDPSAEPALRTSLICGTPDEVVAGIRAFRDALGDDIHFVCRSVFPGMPPDVQARAVSLLGEKVLPAVR